MAGGRGPASTAADLVANEIAAPVPSDVFGAIANVFFSNKSTVALLVFGTELLAGVPMVPGPPPIQGTVLGAFRALHGASRVSGGVHGLGGDRRCSPSCWRSVLMAAAALCPGILSSSRASSSRADALAVHGPAAAKVAVGAVPHARGGGAIRR